jgi:glycosyltransferase involved in cell wall biosynthesis
VSVASLPTQQLVESAHVRPTGRERPLRVCHVSLTLKTGGLERLLADFARHYDRSACEMEFVAIQEIGQFAEVIRAAGCRLHLLRKSGRLGQVRQLARLFRDGVFDIVHTHNTYPHLYATPAARWAGVPIVIQTRHGQRAGHGWKSRLQYRWAARFVDQIVAVSHDAARLTVDVDGIPRAKVRTIWNGIDLEDFEYRGPGEAPVAVSVARLSAEKDIPTLLHALKLACATAPDLKLRLIGDGPERGRLESLTRELGLADRVEFLGDCRNVAAKLAEGAVFVSSSLTEGLSLTILEAMAVGLPVIVTAVGGNPEIVMEGVTGRLVPPRDPVRLASALVEVALSACRGREWGRAGRRRAEDEFDVRRMVADYQALYAELAAARNRTTRTW